MRNIRLLFCLSLLLVGGGFYNAHAQESAAPVKKADEGDKGPVSGKPEVTYLEHRDMTVGSVLVYLVGGWEGIRDFKDVLELNVRLRAKGKKLVQPDQVELGLKSYSEKPKYVDDHKLTLVADGQTILSQVVPGTFGNNTGNSEHYRLTLGYQDFVKFANAKKAVLKFGGTTVELTEQMSKSLRDLDGKIER